MKIRWRLAAVSDLGDIRNYISEENPAAAEAALKGRFVEYMWADPDRRFRVPAS